jgi:hypothetical protein
MISGDPEAQKRLDELWAREAELQKVREFKVAFQRSGTILRKHFDSMKLALSKAAKASARLVEQLNHKPEPWWSRAQKRKHR